VNLLGRYTSLVRQLSASELAGLAARRAYRAARKAFYRGELNPDFNRLLGSFGASTSEELSSRALGWRGGRSWAEVLQRPGVLAALHQDPEAKARALARAEAALHRSFDVFGTRITFAQEEIDWSLDVVSGHRYPSEAAGDLQLRFAGADPKFPWVFGRLDSLIALGQGYWASTEPQARDRYATELVAQVDSFLRLNPVGVGVHWTCTMEVALRAANLAQALLMFADAPALERSKDFVVRTLWALSEHTRFVEAHLEDEGAVPNNHLLANHVGLLVVGLLFPELPGATRHVGLAVNGLQEQMRFQVHRDGASFEGSIPYHRLAVELFTLAHVTALSNGVALGHDFDARLHQMYRVAQAYCSEEGRAPQLGDNDSGRALPFADRESLDHGYLASLGAVLFDDPTLKREGAPLPDEALWLFGIGGQVRHSVLEARALPKSFSSNDGGWHVLRGEGVLVTVSAGKNGQRGVGGHSHNDKLSFELHVNGEPTLVDPGSPTYTRQPALRNAFRCTAAHNTPQVDGREQAALSETTLFALPNTCVGRVEQLSFGPNRDCLTVSHTGFSPVELSRTFTLDKPRRVLTVTDVFRGTNRHVLAGRLHLPDTHVELRPSTGEERALWAQVVPACAMAGKVAALGPRHAPRARVLFAEGLSIEAEDAHFSAGYGQLSEAKCLVYRWEGELPTSLTCVVWMF
jgi:hypothetical protein